MIQQSLRARLNFETLFLIMSRRNFVNFEADTCINYLWGKVEEVSMGGVVCFITHAHAGCHVALHYIRVGAGGKIKSRLVSCEENDCFQSKQLLCVILPI